MRHTHKIIIAAIAVLFAIMPISVQARHTEDTFYMQYQEGQTMVFHNPLLILET